MKSAHRFVNYRLKKIKKDRKRDNFKTLMLKRMLIIHYRDEREEN